VIAFLQNQDDPVLPNLQDKSKDKKDLNFYSVTKNRYGRGSCIKVRSNVNDDLAEIKKTFVTKNTKPVAQLVLEFLDYYFLSPDIYMPQIDISKGGFIDTETDRYTFLDIVEPFNEGARVGAGCRNDSFLPHTYTKFAFGFCSSLVNL